MGKKMALVMDDEEIVRNVAGEMLRYLGYDVQFARDGNEAIDIIKKAKEDGQLFDTVIMDLTIPGGKGGKETIKKLHNIDPHVKAILSSGYTNDPTVLNYKERGFIDFVPKPYTVERLDEALHK